MMSLLGPDVHWGLAAVGLPHNMIFLSTLIAKGIDRDRTRTCNPQIRSLVPYPLGHTVSAIGVDEANWQYLTC